MRPTSDLAKLDGAIKGRIDRLRKRFNYACTMGTGDRPPNFSYCVVELDNVVVSGLRQFAISCLGRCRTASGIRVSSAVEIKVEAEAAAYILSVVNPTKHASLGAPTSIPRKDEGTVRDPKDIDKVLSSVSASNQPTFFSALALNTSLFRDLATFRNFYAHRNADTWRKTHGKFQSLGVLGAASADEAVSAVPVASSVKLYSSWLDDAELFFDLALM